MKLIISLTVLVTMIPALNAHCLSSDVKWRYMLMKAGIYPVVSVNGATQSKTWQYVRKLGPGPPPYSSPEEPARGWPHNDIFSDEIRCGRGAFASAKTTETLLVTAGDNITFFTYANFRGDNTTQIMYHPGAAQLYLSKAPNDELESYAGDGDWFKIKDIGTTDGKTWDLRNKESLSVTIPKSTPPGKYLLKVEYIAYHQAQRIQGFEFYLACAQVEIRGPGGGSPGPMVKFPGAYDWFERSIWRPHSMTYWGERPGDNFTNPGPKVWTG